MTDKQEAFALAYASDPELNPGRAYMSVYKNCKTLKSAATCASRLLKNVEVRAYIDELLEKIKSSKIATAQEVQERLTAIMRGEVDTVIPVYEYKGKQKLETVGTPVSEITKAAVKLGEIHGLFTKKIEFKNTPQIVDDI